MHCSYTVSNTNSTDELQDMHTNRSGAQKEKQSAQVVNMHKSMCMHPQGHCEIIISLRRYDGAEL